MTSEADPLSTTNILDQPQPTQYKTLRPAFMLLPHRRVHTKEARETTQEERSQRLLRHSLHGLKPQAVRVGTWQHDNGVRDRAD
jgi:hypothetical protein